MFTLNLETYSRGHASTGGNTYDEAAVGYTSAWVGTATRASPAGSTTPPAMTTAMQPLDVTDQSGQDTTGSR